MKKENILKLKFNKQSVTELNVAQLGTIYGGTNTNTNEQSNSNSNRTITTNNSTNCNSHEN
jgi:hypothetical protein